MRKNSIKNTRLNGEVQKVLADIIRTEIKDPRVGPVTSVTAVEVATDLKTCKVWICALGDHDAQMDTIAGLESAMGFIRKNLAQTLNLRHTPVFHFILDTSLEYGINMSKLIDEVNKGE